MHLSNKTISKWECGKGIPDSSIMVELCEILEIGVNELLSGEHISTEEYKEKADENIILLINEPKKLFKKNILSIILNLSMELILVLFILLCIYMNVMNGADLINYIDLPALLIVLGTPLIILTVTGFLKDLLYSFKIGLFFCNEYMQEQKEKSLNAVKILMLSALVSGFIISIVSFINTLVSTPMDSKEIMHILFAIDLLGVLYGGIICILMIPVLGRIYKV